MEEIARRADAAQRHTGGGPCHSITNPYGAVFVPAQQRIGGVNLQTGTSYTFQSSDYTQLVSFSNASAIAATLPEATVFGNLWYTAVENTGAGTLTITPTTSTIDGAANLALTQNQGCFIYSDGTNFYTERGMASGSALTVTSGANPGNVSVSSLSFTSIGMSVSNLPAGSYLIDAILSGNISVANLGVGQQMIAQLSYSPSASSKLGGVCIVAATPSTGDGLSYYGTGTLLDYAVLGSTTTVNVQVAVTGTINSANIFGGIYAPVLRATKIG
jgi:hypothetical protein